jgi:hypothetical protein
MQVRCERLGDWASEQVEEIFNCLRIAVLINVREVMASLEGIIHGSRAISVPLSDLGFARPIPNRFLEGGGKRLSG